MERMAASAPRHTLTMRRRQTAPRSSILGGRQHQDRPEEPTAERPEVLDVNAARRTLFEAEKKK